MEAIQLLERTVFADEVPLAPEEVGYTLHIAGVYEDGVTRDLRAFIGVAEPPDSQFARTSAYLQAVARKAQLDFIPQERKRPPGLPRDHFHTGELQPITMNRHY